jgi:NAD(P)-dependent dehydrogenase (short-subunit alcohol dehydrogenase family)
MAEFSAYSASKHALVGLMRSAAAECAPNGLRINCINPATTGTSGQVLPKQGRRKGCYVANA